MATEEDLKKDESEGEDAPDSSRASEPRDDGEADEALAADAAPSSDEGGEGEIRDSELAAKSARPPADSDADEEEEEDEGAPIQLGYVRYVYAAYMAFAMFVGFLAAKVGHMAWYRLGQWKPAFGEPHDEIVYPLAGVIGLLAALYYWRHPKTRRYADEVAEELSKVTWPNRKEVINSTTVVIIATIFSTLFFALMDEFWQFVTDKIYRF